MTKPWRSAELRGGSAPPAPKRGWAKLYVDHVLQADEGADLDFLVGGSGRAVPTRVSLNNQGRGRIDRCGELRSRPACFCPYLRLTL